MKLLLTAYTLSLLTTGVSGNPTTCADGLKCYHGGSCLKVHGSIHGEDYICDCTTAEGDGIKYAGQYCQHEVKEQNMCDDEMFCIMGGSCMENKHHLLGHTYYKCECPASREGPHCEYPKGEMKSCSLQCENGGQCSVGIKDYRSQGPFASHFGGKEGHIGYEHCVCPDGFTGVTCKLHLKKCGDKKCYHGAECVEGDNGKQHCDCNTAHTDTTSYAGLACEHESTSFCDPLPGQKQEGAFCTNHGSCITEHGKRHQGCNCVTGFSGDRCEHLGTEPACTLDCKNGGSCRHGIKGGAEGFEHGNFGDQSMINGPTHGSFGFDLAPLHGGHQNGMHCSCPDGYAGVTCDVKAEVCHDEGEEKKHKKHYCLNGSKCVHEGEDSNKEKIYSCDCKQVDESLLNAFAGRFCEHAATEFCTGDKTRLSHSFCTNGGKCRAVSASAIEEHKGCDCPAEYEGKHCQLPKGTLEPPSANSEEPATEGNSGKDKGVIAGVSLLVIALGVGLAVAMRKRFGRKRPSSAPEIVAAGSLDPDGSTMARKQETEIESQATSEAEEDEEMSNVEVI